MRQHSNLYAFLLLITALSCLLLGCGLGTLGARLAPAPTPTPPPTPTPIVLVATPTPLPPEMLAAADVEEQLVINVYERVSPAVVFITSRILRFSFFGPVPEEGTGSGFIYDKEGHIVTNYHVIEGAQDVEVTLADGTTVPAEIIGTDPYNDLAVLKVDVPAHKLQPVELGSSANLRVGQRAIAIGNPFGLDRTLTTGVISSLGRVIEREGEPALGEMIQTDAAINPGNSGGPLLDSQGRVIGVNTAIKSPSGGSVGIGFAVPVDTVKRVVPELIAKGRYSHPWLGFEGQAYQITPSLAEALGLPVDHGLLIARIYRGSPADKAGLRGATRQVWLWGYRVLIGGDIVVAIDGHPVDSMDSLIIYLENHTVVGQEVTLTIIRDSQQMDISVVVGERPVEGR